MSSRPRYSRRLVSGPVAVLPLLGLVTASLVTALSGVETWLGQWLDSGLYYTVVCFSIIGPFAATSGYLVGAQILDRAVVSAEWQSNLSVIRVVARYAMHAVLLPYVVCSTLVGTALLLATHHENSFGRPPLLLLAIGVLAVCALGLAGLALGVAVGRPRLFPFVPFLAYGLSLVSAHTRFSRQSSLLPVLDLRWDPIVAPVDSQLVRLVIWTFFVGAATFAIGCVALWLRRDRPVIHAGGATAVAVPAALLVVLMISLCSSGAGAWNLGRVRAQPRAPLCAADQGKGRKVCLWPNQRFLLARYRAALGRADALAGGVATLPATFEQVGLQIPRAWTVETTASIPSEAEIVLRMVEGALGPSAQQECTAVQRSSSVASMGALAQAVLVDRVTGSSLVPPGDPGVFDRLLAMDHEDQDRWLNEALRPDQVCRPAAIDRENS